MPSDFSSLGLAPGLVRAAGALGFTRPTPIQQAAIAPALAGRDLLATAQTGSGKTAAFGLPLLQRLGGFAANARRDPRALVIVPTRELAAQVGEVLRGLAGASGGALAERPRIAVLFGGVSANPQMMGLRGGADLVVATPGRLLELVDSRALRLSDVRLLVLDEADRLLDLGFSEELNRVLALLPPARQNLFFSATFAPAVQALAGTLLTEPVRVEVAATEATLPDIAQRVIEVDAPRRTELLRHLATEGKWTSALVFVATQYAAEHVAWKLYRNGVFAAPFHGGLSQGARRDTLAQFANGQWDLLVTTDLAARGIDIPQLQVVVNHDLPRSATDYTHRIGRTGRAGASGAAISFVSHASDAHWRLIEKRQGLALPRERVPGFEPTPLGEEDAARAAAALAVQGAPGSGGIKGRRPSKKDKLRAAAAAKP